MCDSGLNGPCKSHHVSTCKSFTSALIHNLQVHRILTRTQYGEKRSQIGMCNVHFSYLLGCGVCRELKGGVGVWSIGSSVWGVSVGYGRLCGLWDPC